MDSSLYWLLCLLSITSLFFLSQAKKRRPTSSGRLPPGPTPLPIIGNLHLLGNKPHRSITTLSKTYGPIMTLRLGSVNTVFVSSPEVVREMMQKHDAILSHRFVQDSVRISGHENGSLVWMQPTQRWRSLRKLCNTQLFTPQRLDAQHDLRRQKVQEMVHHIADLSSRGEAVEIGRLTFTTTLNLLSRTIFSVDLVGFDSDSSHDLKHLVQGITAVSGRPNVSDFFPSIAWLDLQGVRRRSTELFKQMHQIFQEQIERRLQIRSEGNVESSDFLDSLLEWQREDPENIDQNTLKSLLHSLFVAGTDTSSNAVEWTMAELLRNPDIMVKAQEEVKRVIGTTRQVEEHDMNQLPYLQAVVKETLRVHQPSPFLIPRRAESAIEVLGYVVPEGTRVFLNNWAIGRDHNVWDNPDEFRPERFLDNEKDFRGRDYDFFPFGLGRRICPGMPLAAKMVHLVLASLLQRFEWKLPQGMKPEDVDVNEKYGVTLAMARPIIAIATPNA